MVGLQPHIAPHINSRLFLIPTILGMAAALCLALALMLRDRLVPAGVLSQGCGVALSVVAACVAQRPLPADHVLRRIAVGNGGTEHAATLARHLAFGASQAAVGLRN